MTNYKHITFGDRVGAKLYAHQLSVSPTLPCWTLVTDGLASLGQAELVFTIAQRGAARTNFPDGVLGYIPAVMQFTSEGRIVKHGDISGYRVPGPFNLGEFVGLAFMAAVAIPDVDLPGDALAGVFLTEGELGMAMNCSVTRVLNQLGKQSRYFPTPFWSDPTRKSVYAVEDAGKSLLSKTERLIANDATAILRGNAMVLTLPVDTADQVADGLEQRRVVALVTGLSGVATAALVWAPGQLDPEGIVADGQDGAAAAAVFVALVPSDESSDEIRFMEDGYVVLLSSASVERLALALRSHVPVQLSGGSPHRELTVAYASAG